MITLNKILNDFKSQSVEYIRTVYSEHTIKRIKEGISDLQDKLRRRNLQIKDLKKALQANEILFKAKYKICNVCGKPVGNNYIQEVIANSNGYKTVYHRLCNK